MQSSNRSRKPCSDAMRALIWSGIRADPRATAALLSDLFGWHTRWEGPPLNHGFTIHVNSDDHYIGRYTGPNGGADQRPTTDSYSQRGGPNHLGIIADDLAAVEARVKAHGFATHSHADHEPGRRFYFTKTNGIEIEVVCYA